MLKEKRWILKTLTLVVGLSLGILAFTYIVNPYDIYDVPPIQGITSNKNVAKNKDWYIKLLKVKRLEPDTLIFGSSRAEVAIDPEHPGWQSDRVYNFAFAGATMVEIADRFKAAYATHPFKRALIGLDFFSFNSYGKDRFADGGVSNLYAQTLFSVNAFKDSIRTLKKQDQVKHPPLLGNGQIAWNCKNDRVARSGHRAMFQGTEVGYLKKYFPAPFRQFSFTHQHNGMNTFEELRSILHLCREKKIELILYTSPIHARLLEVINQVGLWPKFEAWKRELASQVDEETGLQGDQWTVALWDFADFNDITTEPVPNLGDTESHMKYYWEPAHPKKEAGDLVLDRILNHRQKGRDIPENFGFLLTAENLGEHLSRGRRMGDAYRQGFSQDVAEIGTILTGSGFSRSAVMNH